MMIFQTHPMHGKHIAYNVHEAEYNNKQGWTTVTEDVFYGKVGKVEVPANTEKSRVIEASEEAAETDDEDRETAAAAYELKFGRAPHHRMKTDSILKAINDDSE